MTKRANPKKPLETDTKKKLTFSEINRRKEWRLELPLPVIVQGSLPGGKKFKEKSTLENISSDGAFFGLDRKMTIDTSLSLFIELPSKLTEGKKLKMNVKGKIIRVEKLYDKGKKQGVALKFNKEIDDEEFQIVMEDD
jgi:hypothetical protein